MDRPFSPLYLAGPTGCGKTSVALQLVALLPAVEIINADAYQIYRGMECLSAAPSDEERSHCPHHLFGVLDPSEECDAATFSRIAKAAIADVAARAIPLVVGGSGLYLKAITHGLAPTPKGDPELRASLEARSLEELVAEYTRLDPDGAAQTNLKNRRYVTRNLEICLLTGQPASLLKKEWQDNAPKIRAIYLHREREDLYERINRRTSQMVENGLLEEVARLGSLSLTAEKAIGLREVKALLAGEMDESSCLDQIRQATRRYAKRQESWFKRETAFQTVTISPDESPRLTAARILTMI
jgi:tRNA dimethylallyltransferase